jgi:hypothetical protein
MDKHIKTDELTEKLTNGIRSAVKSMIEKSKKLDEEIVIARNGKVVKIKAKEL